MSSITLYADEECTLVAASGMMGAYKRIFGGSPIITTASQVRTFDGKEVTCFQIGNYNRSTLEISEATTIQLSVTDTNVYQYFYISPIARIAFKCIQSGTNDYNVGSIQFQYNDGNGSN